LLWLSHDLLQISPEIHNGVINTLVQVFSETWLISSAAKTWLELMAHHHQP
jgi:hypothetical protein